METKDTEKLTDLRFSISAPSLSPDGKEIVFLRENHSNELWIVNADGTNPHRVPLNLDEFFKK